MEISFLAILNIRTLALRRVEGESYPHNSVRKAGKYEARIYIGLTDEGTKDEASNAPLTAKDFGRMTKLVNVRKLRMRLGQTQEDVAERDAQQGDDAVIAEGGRWQADQGKQYAPDDQKFAKRAHGVTFHGRRKNVVDGPSRGLPRRNGVPRESGGEHATGRSRSRWVRVSVGPGIGPGAGYQSGVQKGSECKSDAQRLHRSFRFGNCARSVVVQFGNFLFKCRVRA
jgi:hypothetical protein